MEQATEQSMIEAHKAGRAYWRMNRPHWSVTRDMLRFHARTCGWQGEDNDAWLAGYYGEMARNTSWWVGCPNGDDCCQGDSADCLASWMAVQR